MILVVIEGTKKNLCFFKKSLVVIKKSIIIAY